jgi:hypothetical protein
LKAWDEMHGMEEGHATQKDVQEVHVTRIRKTKLYCTQALPHEATHPNLFFDTQISRYELSFLRQYAVALMHRMLKKE